MAEAWTILDSRPNGSISYHYDLAVIYIIGVWEEDPDVYGIMISSWLIILYLEARKYFYYIFPTWANISFWVDR